ncbi:MAG: hypothetical protein M1818_007672 [Claussenomyces sp. TS43310]|nr:MAG: hypothetical protein M1818_007672 [Claussenomyces sp. TS43310]
MASLTSSAPPTSIDPRRIHQVIPSPSIQITDHMSHTPIDANNISPCSFYPPESASRSSSIFASPLDNDGPSDFSDYNTGDDFWGIDFDAAGLQDIDAGLQTFEVEHLTRIEPPTIEKYLSGSRTSEAQPPDQPAAPALPNSSCNTIQTGLHTRTRSYEYNTTEMPFQKGHTMHQSSLRDALAAPLSASIRPPDLQLVSTGSSHDNEEGNGSGRLTQMSHSPRVTITPWGSGEECDLPAESDIEDESLGGLLAPLDDDSQAALPSGWRIEADDTPTNAMSHASKVDNENEDWNPDWAFERTGLGPERRKSISNIEVPNFKDQARKEELEEKIRSVEEWRSQAEATDNEDIDEEEPLNHLQMASNNLNYGRRRRRRRAKSTGTDFNLHASASKDEERDFIYPTFLPTPQESRDPDEGHGIEPVSDAASIRENRIQEGQSYFNFGAKEITARDINLLARSRHFHDSPAFPKAMERKTHPETANAAMAKYNEAADTYSLLSRQATWGTRRRSEPSLAAIESIENGSFIKRLSFGREKKEKKPGIFKEFANNIVRKKSDAGSNTKNKRTRNEGMPANFRKESTSSLAPPILSQISSRHRPESPRLDTSVGGPQGHPRRAHSGSRSLSATSPQGSKRPLDFVNKALRRARSKSDLSNEGLVGMWRSSGGPPVPTLASSLVDNEDLRPMEHSDADADADEDDDDEPVDEGERMVFDSSSSIVPNFNGFREHALRLNPNMEPSYLADRIAHQQVVRYKALLDWRVKHSRAVNDRTCSAEGHCVSLGGSPTLLDAKGQLRHNSLADSSLQVVADLSEGDTNPEGQLGIDSFPPGVPMPLVPSLPAEFECQLCFKVKKVQKPSDWTKHVHEDVQPFTCTYSNCREPKSFKRKADWVRHENERHRQLEWWTCQIDECAHKCYRKDNFLQHLVREHKLPEPKHKTKAAVKKASGDDEQVWAVVRRCHHETQAKPQDEPCKFCGKAFNSWKKLTVHLAKHMEHISLPILGLVEQQQVNADTIVSPVEALPARQAPTTTVNMHRDLSASSGIWSSSAGISPNMQSGMQYASPNYPNHSPSVHDVPQFRDIAYDTAYQSISPARDYNLHVPIAQHQHPIFNDNDLSFEPYREVDASLNTQPRPFTNRNFNMQQSRGFTTTNDPGLSDTMYQQNYRPASYSTSNQMLRPNPGSFQTGARQTSGFQDNRSRQPLTPEVAGFVSTPQRVPTYAAYNALGGSDINHVGFHDLSSANVDMDFSQMMVASNRGNQFYSTNSRNDNAGFSQIQQLQSEKRFQGDPKGHYEY